MRSSYFASSAFAILFFSLLAADVFADDFRTWSDASGKFKVEAKYSKVEGEKVILIGKDGKKMAIPIAKLSDKDRGFLEAKMEASKSDSPFEVIGDDAPSNAAPKSSSAKEASREANSKESSSKSSMGSKSTPPTKETDSSESESATTPSKPKELRVDFQSITPHLIVEGAWSVKVDEAKEAAGSYKPFVLPASKIEREEITRIAHNTIAKRMVVSYSPNDPFKKERNNATRLLVVDLETGKILGNASGAGRWEAMAIGDDGETIVVNNKTEGTPLGQLGTVKVKGGKLIPIDLWRPYDTLPKEDKEKDVTFAEFANENKLVTVSQGGNVVVWNSETKEPIVRFDYHGACQPSLSPNRNQLGFSGGDLVGFFDIASGEATGVKGAPLMNYWLKSAYSPSGKRFAAATIGKLMVWEVESGEVLFEGSFDGVPVAQGLQFPDENFLLLSNDYLVELKNRIKLWQFVGTNYMTRIGSTPVFGVNTPTGLRLMPTKLPTPDAAKMLENALKQTDLFVWRKGIDVKLDMTQVPQQFQGEVNQALQEQIKKMECRINPNAAITLKASISGPKAEAVSYFFGGSFVLQQYNSTFEIVYGNTTIWTSTATNTPGMINRGSKEEMQKQIDEAGRKPNLAYFGQANLPQFLQKPVPNTPGVNRQTIGMSRVTPTGIQTEK